MCTYSACMVILRYQLLYSRDYYVAWLVHLAYLLYPSSLLTVPI
jgi:hypothetical protein